MLKVYDVTRWERVLRFLGKRPPADHFDLSKRERGWMGTSTGRKFFPLDPRAGDVDIRDIARGLSMTCRYAGQVKRFYCPTPDQRVLTADLRWVPAGDLRVGDDLLGFDEHAFEPGQTGAPRRRYRPSKVLTALPVRRRVVRLEFDNGKTITASAEHPWLVASKAGGGNQRWRTTAEIASLVEAGRFQRMNEFVSPWKYEESRAAGWLAGIYDGEGSFSSESPAGTQLNIGQNPGLVCDDIRRHHQMFGFNVREHVSKQYSNVVQMQMAGGWREIARLLGSVRPQRLLAKFVERLHSGEFAKQMNGNVEDRRTVVRCYDEGEQWVAGLETSSRTYLCEGFAAHNSVAEHCYHVSCHVHQQFAREGLLHDSSEAYIGDMIRPLKHQPEMQEFRTAEAKIEHAVAARFNLDVGETASAAVKEIDNRILVDEILALSACPDYYLVSPGLGDVEPLGIELSCWPPTHAEKMFLHRYEELFGVRVPR